MKPSMQTFVQTFIQTFMQPATRTAVEIDPPAGVAVAKDAESSARDHAAGARHE